VIATCGVVVAHLGGPRGDRLSLSLGGGPFEPVADLGWSEARQCAPQRRLLLTPDALFVLEPKERIFLTPPFRARRFTHAGEEQPASEDEIEGPGALIYSATRSRPDGAVRFVHGGIDIETGRPQRWERVLHTPLVVRNDGRSWGSVFAHEHAGHTDWWYPIRSEGLVRERQGALRTWTCDPGPMSEVSGRAVCVAREGVIVDGEWIMRDRPYFPPWNGPLTALAAEAPDGSLVVLHQEHGPRPGRVPPGWYTALARVGDVLYAIEEKSGSPRLVPVQPV